MKHLLRFAVVIMAVMVMGSCEKDPKQNEDNTGTLRLKTGTPTTDCSDETAWANGPRYLTKGNWATFIAVPATLYNFGIDPDPTPSFIIYAGKTGEAGRVYFYNGPNGSIRIIIRLLSGCFSFQNVTEAIKIQGYTVPPFGVSPVPGLFTTYKGNGTYNAGQDFWYVDVAPFAYYGIHLDLKYCCVEPL